MLSVSVSGHHMSNHVQGPPMGGRKVAPLCVLQTRQPRPVSGTAGLQGSIHRVFLTRSRVPAVYLGSAEVSILSFLSVCRINNLRFRNTPSGFEPRPAHHLESVSYSKAS
jgi:hypothetical protein